MLIGDDECYLRIEKTNLEDQSSWATFRVEAKLIYDGRAEFLGSNNLTLISAGDQDRSAFIDFAELRSHRLVLTMSDEGSLELRRDVHGNIDVLFSIGCRRVGPHWKVGGDVRVDGEYTQDFLHEFKKLVFRTP